MPREMPTRPASEIDEELAIVRSLYLKALRYRDVDPPIALAQARRSAEAVCFLVFRSAASGPRRPSTTLGLDELIRNLSQANAIPEHIRISLATIQRFGNYGAHYQGSDDVIDREYVTPCLSALRVVVSWYFGQCHGRELPLDDPTAPPDPERGVMSSEEGVYYGACQLAFADGIVTKTERRLLDDRQKELGIVPSRARELEDSARAAAGVAISPVSAKQVALLYKRNAQPDETVLRWLESQLSEHGYKVFIDRHLSIGVQWAREIQRQICSSYAVIPLLSERSVQSEMLSYEVRVAQEARRGASGPPHILPVRVGFAGALPDELAASLDRIEYFLWEGPEDHQRLVASVLEALDHPGLPKPTPPEPPGGAVPLASEYYVVRPSDDQLRAAISRQDSTTLIKGARQMGKTSLLARGLQQARDMGLAVAFTDLQKLDSSHFETLRSFYEGLGGLLADQLDLDTFPQDTWKDSFGANWNFERYVRRDVVGKLAAPLVWGLDEVDRLFQSDFRNEVFGLFRSWHNGRALDPTAQWLQRLTLIITYSTEAYLFITDINQSPFNVAEPIRLSDFTRSEVAHLNEKMGSPFRKDEDVARVHELLGGQPYLTRRAFHDVATTRLTPSDLQRLADRDEGPFGDHLRRILVLVTQERCLVDTVRSAIAGEPIADISSFYRLRSAGILAGESPSEARIRCPLYRSYLGRFLA